MGCVRMGFNLFTRAGWSNAGYVLREWGVKKFIWQMRDNLWTDTFGRFVCMLIGHRKDVFNGEDPGETPRWICRRCIREVKKGV